jgi:hypothetical protein
MKCKNNYEICTGRYLRLTPEELRERGTIEEKENI